LSRPLADRQQMSLPTLENLMANASWLRLAALASALALAAPAWAGSEGTFSTFFGHLAGANNSGDANQNTFIGASAGQTNNSGASNTFLGTFAGNNNSTGSQNTYLGMGAGAIGAIGSGNVFVGYGAGYNETGSNKLYIDSCLGQCGFPLVYGEFDNHLLKFNGVLNVRANGVAKSQLHFSQGDTETGGWLTSAGDNNFFASSGARYDNGNWVQRSPDGKAVVAGSGGTGYRIFTSLGFNTGVSIPLTLRLHIDYGGNLGLNTAAVAGTPIVHSSGASLTAGGVWTDASSREYKEHIEALSTEDAQRTLAALNPVRYNYKADPREKHVGFIAEDVPELVAREGRKSLSPMDIVAVLTKVLQEKSEKMDALEATVVRLEAELNRLKLRDAMARE
jgi:hypothetical protein